MHKQMIIALFLVGILGILMLSSFATHFPVSFQERWQAPAWADTLKNPSPDQPIAVQQGEELYQLHCWSCHGETGLGDGAAGGSLGVKPANFHEATVKKQSDGALFWKMSTGRGNMPSFKEVFSEEQRWQLVAYIRKLSH